MYTKQILHKTFEGEISFGLNDRIVLILTFQDDNSMCSLSPKDFDKKYYALHLRFYRPCGSETAESDSTDSEPLVETDAGQELESFYEHSNSDAGGFLSE